MNSSNSIALTLHEFEALCHKFVPLVHKIFTGKDPSCHRHQMYNMGGKKKAQLRNFNASNVFTDEQHEIVASILVKKYCSEHSKYFDYVFKVMIPELEKRIVMEVFKVFPEQAKDILNHGKEMLEYMLNDKICQCKIIFLNDEDKELMWIKEYIPSEPVQQSFDVANKDVSETSQLTSNYSEPVKQSIDVANENVSETSQLTSEPVQQSFDVANKDVSETSQLTSEPVQQSIDVANKDVSETSQLTSEPVKQSIDVANKDVSETSQLTSEPVQQSIDVANKDVSETSQLTSEPFQQSIDVANKDVSETSQLTSEPVQQSIDVANKDVSKTSQLTSAQVALLNAINNHNIGAAKKALKTWEQEDIEKHVAAAPSARRKVVCPVCSREVVNLKVHLMSRKHLWTKEKAESARINFKLNLERKPLESSIRKSKQRFHVRQICPLSHCMKEVKRLGNHLRQFHKITPSKVVQHVKNAQKVLSSEDESSASERATSDEEEYTSKVKKLYSKDLFHRGVGMHEECDSDDSDWLLSTFGDIHGSRILTSNKNENAKCSDNVDFENHGNLSTDNDSDNSSKSNSALDAECTELSDYEDTEDKFYVTSQADDIVLESFKSWLISADGGYRPERTSKQHKNVILAILNHRSNIEPLKFSNLVEKEFLESWIQICDKSKQPGTIKTYLCSVLCFYDYCEVTGCGLLPSELIGRMRTVIRKWGHNLIKKIQVRSYEKQLNDLNRLPTPEELRKYDCSKVVQYSKALLKNATCKDSWTRKEFCAIRDYLISTLIMDNASRSGAIANMLLEEVGNTNNSDGGCTIAVKKHKTGYKGPAFITMTIETFKNLTNYIRYVRNSLQGINSGGKEPVFVSWAGNKMASSMVTGQLSSFWAQALGRDCGDLTTTLVRKYATTTIHKNQPELKQATANLLCHAERTASMSYNLIDKQRRAFQTSQQVREAMRTDFDTNEINLDLQVNDLKEIFSSEINDGFVSTEIIRDRISSDARLSDLNGNEKKEKALLDSVRYIIKKEGTHTKSADERVTEKVPDTPSAKCISMSRQRKKYTDSDNTIIWKCLGDQIRDTNNAISRAECTEIIKNTPMMAQLVSKFGMHSLIIKIRTERAKFLNET
ncbi:uncharacterized protein LOC130629797 isoform X3 [Hydractinia symbiolongicarpus]|uniref:uncharacterized protein LOC130629797 isoform X3 n=1 Tax=Hydractinia symbiolongicarpus TaxID=13093 RepID=UPI00255055A1|nr:uncharacterized protein LOC130629797 isoform X3 [Hydractinia symbiolongicarpus]